MQELARRAAQWLNGELKPLPKIIKRGECGKYDKEEYNGYDEYGDNITYTLDENGVLTISGTGAIGNYGSFRHIPWFNESKRTSIAHIQNGVTRIGAGIFFDCWNLTSLSIPDSVTEIEYWAFRSCEKLKWR